MRINSLYLLKYLFLGFKLHLESSCSVERLWFACLIGHQLSTRSKCYSLNPLIIPLQNKSPISDVFGKKKKINKMRYFTVQISLFIKYGRLIYIHTLKCGVLNSVTRHQVIFEKFVFITTTHT